MRLNEEQIKALEAVQAAQVAYQTEWAQIARKVDDYRRELETVSLSRRDTVVAQASLAGVPTRRIAREGLGTKNEKTARDAILHGLTLVAPVVQAPQAEDSDRITVSDGLINVTLHGDDFAPYRSLVGDVTASTGQFTFENGALMPVNADDDGTWLNPVVQVVMAQDGVWKARVLAAVEGGEQA